MCVRSGRTDKTSRKSAGQASTSLAGFCAENKRTHLSAQGTGALETLSLSLSLLGKSETHKRVGFVATCTSLLVARISV